MSGYLFFKNLEYWNNQEYVKKIKSRFWTLFIPYILWNLIGFCFFVYYRCGFFVKSDSFTL